MTHRFFFAPRAALLASLLALVVVAGAASGDPKIKCGQPTKSGGFVTITIALTRGEESHVIVLRDISFGPSFPDTDKAEFLVQLIKLVEDPNKEFLVAERAPGSNEVELHPQNNWKLKGHGIQQDGTGEPDWIAYDGSADGSAALCSLSGTASGTSPTGGQGMVAIQAFGVPAQVPTANGMPAQLVEQLLMQQLQSHGVAARWAVPSDFEGAFASMEHDAMVLYVPPPPGNAPATLFESVMDQGLTLDLAAVAAPPSPPSAVPAISWMGAPALSIEPSVLGQGEVTIRYDTSRGASDRAQGDQVRLVLLASDGRRLVTLLDHGPGLGMLRWNGEVDGHPLASGAYFLRLESASGVAVRRFICVR